MNAKRDWLGLKVGEIEVVDAAPTRDGKAFWTIRCNCGANKEVSAGQIRDWANRRRGFASCGCSRCEHCGELFQKRVVHHGGVSQKLCSDECRRARRKEDMESFYRRHSEAESKPQSYKLPRRYMVPQSCIVCSDVIRGTRRIVCSAECRKIRHYDQSTAWRTARQRYTCSVCLEEYSTTAHWRSVRVCGPACQLQRQRKIGREYWQSLPLELRQARARQSRANASRDALIRQKQRTIDAYWNNPAKQRDKSKARFHRMMAACRALEELGIVVDPMLPRQRQVAAAFIAVRELGIEV